MSLRDELLAQEADAWATFEPMLRSGEDLAFGWSTSEVAGHLAFWQDRCARMLEAIAAGPIEDGAFTVDIDAENDARRPGWAATPVEEALAEAGVARERMLGAWSALQDPSGTAAAWFAEDSTEHYDEHTGGS